MKRNKNVDYLRAFAIIVIIAYHCYAVAGNPWQSHQIPHVIMCFGGELGVTLFFLLSGFGIYWSLYHKEQKNGLPTWGSFMKQRCIRVMPQYYASVVVLILFQLTGLIGMNSLKHLVTYATFTQNLFIETHGSINGTLWTMGTIFQFYLIALLLYRCVRKNCVVSGITSILISVASKFVVYHYVIPRLGLIDYAYFVYGRQVLTALDNFVLGMVAANVVLKVWHKETSQNRSIGAGIVTVGILIALLICSYQFCSSGIYQDNLRGYTVHSILAVLMMVLIISVSLLPQLEWNMMRPLEVVAKYQYGIYLWHMPIIRGLYTNSPLFQTLISKGFIPFFLGILVVTVVVGYYSSIWIKAKAK